MIKFTHIAIILILLLIYKIGLLYSIHYNDDTISVCKIDQVSGRLGLPETVNTGNLPYSIAIAKVEQ